MTTETLTEIELGAGVIDYQDTGGAGPVVVLLHGLAMHGSVWRHVLADLRVDHRCVVPNLPLGSHRRPMHPDADLTLAGHAALIGEFLDRLALTDVVLVGNDWGGAQLLVDHPRVGRLALVACEAFDNYPPGLPGKMLGVLAALPGGMLLLAKAMGLRALRELPIGYGALSRRGIPAEVVADWLRPLLTSKGVRRDLTKYLRAARTELMVAASEGLRGFDRPALVVWAKQDRMMPREHGRRLADLLPNGQLVEIDDSSTLIPEDQPAALAAAIRTFAAA